jgi:hypothetical protein
MSDLPLIDHFTVAIYPFQHALRPEAASTWSRTLASRWSPWWARLRDDWPRTTGTRPAAPNWLPDMALRRALDDAYFFLPFVRRTLFPETEALDRACPLAGPFYENWWRQLLEWTATLPGYCAAVPFTGALRLTCRAGAVRDACVTVQPRRREGPHEVPAGPGLAARLEWVDSILFPTGVGFLALKVALAEAPARLADLCALNAGLRELYPTTLDGASAGLRFPGGTELITLRDLVDLLLQGMGPPAPGEAPDAAEAWIIPADGRPLPELGAYLHGARRPSGYRHSEGEAGQFGDQLNRLTYARLGESDRLTSLPTGPFPSAEDRLVYELAAGVTLGETIAWRPAIPADESLGALLAARRILFWEGGRGMALPASVGFLHVGADPGSEATLASDVEGSYLPLYLYTLYQTQQLLTFANELTAKTEAVAPPEMKAALAAGTSALGRWATELRGSRARRRALLRNLRDARGLMARFVAFRNRYWFNEATRRAPGSELYQKFRGGLETAALYDLVSAEVTAIQEYYEGKQDRRTAALINWFTFVFTPLSAVMGLYSMSFSGGSWLQFWACCAVVLAFSGLVWRWWSRE